MQCSLAIVIDYREYCIASKYVLQLQHNCITVLLYGISIVLPYGAYMRESRLYIVRRINTMYNNTMHPVAAVAGQDPRRLVDNVHYMDQTTYPP